MHQSRGYVGACYLQTAAELFTPIKQRSYALMQVRSGQSVLDVGCGPGIDTVALARLAGPAGHVTGVDHDAAMIAEANQRAAQAHVSAFVEHQQGDATALAFTSETFDSCRSERLFMHLLQPEQALSEMIRVTKTDGWIIVVDTDWSTLSIDTTEVDIERLLVRFRAEQVLHNGYAGRQLYRLFKQQKLADVALEVLAVHTTDYALLRHLVRLDEVESEAVAAGAITPHELQRWHADLERSDGTQTLFASVNVVIVAGRKR